MATKTIGRYKLTKDGKLQRAPNHFHSVSSKIKHQRRQNRLRILKQLAQAHS